MNAKAVWRAECARWQKGIEDVIVRKGLAPFDPSGNDSGDPLDWTRDQVCRAIDDASERAEAENIVLHQVAKLAGEVVEACSPSHFWVGVVVQLSPADQKNIREKLVALRSKLAELPKEK